MDIPTNKEWLKKNHPMSYSGRFSIECVYSVVADSWFPCRPVQGHVPRFVRHQHLDAVRED